jgi:hypothetical protein
VAKRMDAERSWSGLSRRMALPRYAPRSPDAGPNGTDVLFPLAPIEPTTSDWGSGASSSRCARACRNQDSCTTGSWVADGNPRTSLARVSEARGPRKQSPGEARERPDEPLPLLLLSLRALLRHDMYGMHRQYFIRRFWATPLARSGNGGRTGTGYRWRSGCCAPGGRRVELPLLPRITSRDDEPTRETSTGPDHRDFRFARVLFSRRTSIHVIVGGFTSSCQSAPMTSPM